MTLFELGADPERDDQPAAPRGPSVRVRLLVAYEGSGFHGFAAQPGVRTVAGVLADAVRRITGCEVKMTCAGRTDAGVHAWGQVVHFDLPSGTDAVDDLDLTRLQRSLNRMLAPSVVVRAVGMAPEGFHARHSATARKYRYTILNRRVPDPFLAGTAWHVDTTLDFRVMQLACDPFLGEHDFASFCRKPTDEGGTTMRRVVDTRLHDLGEGVLRFDIEATSFCQQMVRSITGAIVEAGLGRLRPGDISAILRARDRQFAPPVAPAHGLCLWEVVYPGDLAFPT